MSDSGPVGSLSMLRPVPLGELQEEASLMVRTDRKYVVPLTSVDHIVSRLATVDPQTRVLEVDGRRRHAYASTYLDTPGLEGYWMAARRRRRRFKVRHRVYLDSGTCFTEVKTRGPRGRTVKNRLPGIDRRWWRHRDALSEVHRHFVADELTRAGMPHVNVSSLSPVLRTRYHRTTLWLPGSESRVTIDSGLGWSLPDSPDWVCLPALAVVETKTGRTGTPVDRAMWTQGHRPVRISKYATGLALLVSDLPSNRWHRTLSRLEPATLLSTE